MNIPYFDSIKRDFPASILVFLVALPLCLGIAVASGASPMTGLLTGVIGGIVVGFLSGSHVSISGPAAGLTVIVLDAIGSLGSFSAFQTAVVIAGVFQLILGLLKAGVLGSFFPSSVIKGMLSSIGLILILKQFPKTLGYEFDFEGSDQFDEGGGHNTFTDIVQALSQIHIGALMVSASALAVMLAWDSWLVKRRPAFRVVPGALLAVVVGAGACVLIGRVTPEYALLEKHFVNLSMGGRVAGWGSALSWPAWSAFMDIKTYGVALMIAVVASIETLLSIQATDKIDLYHRRTPLNRELLAQGAGNLLSGALGGLPITSVVARSSANVIAGGKTRMSGVLHGFWLFLCVLLIPGVLSLIPLSSLAVVLMLVGYKLIHPSIIRGVYQKGLTQFVPFLVTIVSVLLTNLLTGVAIGFVVGMLCILFTNFRNAIHVTKDGAEILIRLRNNATFLNKSVLELAFEEIPDGASVLIDGTSAQFIDHDLIEMIDEFVAQGPTRGIQVFVKRTHTSNNEFFRLSPKKPEGIS
jgi:MFS superfamily sulfate permease-like transporter